MPPTVQKPYWIDEDLDKHEAYYYGESPSDSRLLVLNIRGRSLTLIAPKYLPEFEIREASVGGEYLFIIGQHHEDDEDGEDEDDNIEDERYGILLVAKRCSDRDATFWTLVAHTLYPQTLEAMTNPPPGKSPTPPAGGHDG